MDIQSLYERLEINKRKIIIDSRKTTLGCVFFALKGEHGNGNTFAKEAIAKGAFAAVVDDSSLIIDSNSFILVSDALDTLQQLASYHRSLFAIPVLVIGGSNGKTTTKELIRNVLAQKHIIAVTQENFNNHIGVPLTLFSINTETEIAVIEIGANHIAEHTMLCNLANPTHVLVTNNGKDHLEGFGSYEGVYIANQEIYKYIGKHNGHAFVCSSNQEFMKDTVGLSRTIYGFKTDDEYYFLANSISYYAAVIYKNYTFQSHLAGKFNMENIAAAITIGLFFDVSIEKINLAIHTYKPSMMRSQVIDYKNGKWVIDCYNANPTSMELGINDFVFSSTIPRALILGDMFELGMFSESEHNAIIDLIGKLSINLCILIGKEFKKSFNDNYVNIISFERTQDAKDYISKVNWDSYSVFVKGSRSMKLEELLPFSVKE